MYLNFGQKFDSPRKLQHIVKKRCAIFSNTFTQRLSSNSKNRTGANTKKGGRTYDYALF